jgi:glucose/arabinose dehydrogenase
MHANPRLLVLAVFFTLSSLLPAQAPDAIALPRDAKGIYALLCASCHGADLEGGAGGSLIDDVWKHGADDQSLTASILQGRTDNGMPAFGEVLDAAQTHALIVYIREIGVRTAEKQVKFTRPRAGAVVTSSAHAFRLEEVASGLGIPWSIAFLPGDRILVTERSGDLRLIENGRLNPKPIAGTPKVVASGQGGLLSVAPHPDFASNGWIYLSYSDPGDNNLAMTAVVRGRIRDGRWVDQEMIFQAPSHLYKRGGNHFGSRFVFDGKGYLFFTIGERGTPADAQDLTRPNGKVHRIHEDGRIPADNPFLKVPNAIPSIWSYGHRNPQGLAQHPVDGSLWSAEHGPRGGDELNRVERGLNYGWPRITYGMNYNGTPVTDRTSEPGLEQPVLHWTPSIAVSAIAYATGDRFPQWKNSLFVASLAQQELRRLVLDQGKVVSQEILFKGIGRIRDVVVSPDGSVYVALEDPGRIWRLVPAN